MPHRRIMRRSHSFAATACIAALAYAAPALGCPACFAASSPGALRGFYLSTVLLSTMPFLIIAGFVIMLRRTLTRPPRAARKLAGSPGNEITSPESRSDRSEGYGTLET
jgi:hypothetical protein